MGRSPGLNYDLYKSLVSTISTELKKNTELKIKTYTKEELIKIIECLPKKKILTLEGEAEFIDYNQLIMTLNNL